MKGAVNAGELRGRASKQLRPLFLPLYRTSWKSNSRNFCVDGSRRAAPRTVVQKPLLEDRATP
jgi:hypothetical protein